MVCAMTGSLIGIAWRPAKRAPMETATHGVITPEAGLAPDFRGKPGRRQVTVLFEDDWLAACAELGEARPWTIRRANLLVRGIANPQAVEGRVVIGDIVLEITGETDPCTRMDAQWQGLTAALTPRWRGGVTTRVIAGGTARVGDPVSLDL
jgi:MOSC domain-containing protein YiiM